MFVLTQLYALRWFLAFAVVLLYAASKYHTYQRLAAFKGPFSTGWCELWHSYHLIGTRSHLVYRDVNDRYGKWLLKRMRWWRRMFADPDSIGPIARVGPNDLVTSSPELLAQMNGVRSLYTRSSWFNAATRFEPGKDHIFSELDETNHTKRRAQIAAGYSGKENLTLEFDIDARVQELLQLISSKYLSGDTQSRPFDIGRKIQYFALDVISTVGFGEPFGDITADADLNDYIKSSEEGLTFVKTSTALGLTRFFQWPPVARFLGPKETDKSGFGNMMGSARQTIDTRFSKSLGRSDMLASFVRHGLSKEEVFTEAMLQIMAGSDTTATALRSTMLYLITHPRVCSKLRTEIDGAVSSGAAPISPGIASDDCLRTMPYLQAVVREGLRMHPPVTDVVPKKVPAGGDTFRLDGKTYHLPAGTNIGYNAWGVHHNKTIFGEDAKVFRPERWLLEEKDESSVEQLAAMRRTTEMIFGYGKYQCLGKPVAWLEITKVIFEVSVAINHQRID
jgi:cytochrome P450